MGLMSGTKRFLVFHMYTLPSSEPQMMYSPSSLIPAAIWIFTFVWPLYLYFCSYPYSPQSSRQIYIETHQPQPTVPRGDQHLRVVPKVDARDLPPVGELAESVLALEAGEIIQPTDCENYTPYFMSSTA